MNFHILFAYFPYAFQMIFPSLALSSSLTGAFPLLGRHVADMKSVTNVFMCACVCVCWGKTGPAERVNGKAIGGIFQEEGESEEGRGGGVGVPTRAACQV